MRIYLAGPMRGFPRFNFPAFEKAAAALRAQGHEIFSPAENDLDSGFSPDRGVYETAGGDQPFSLREAMLEDLTWIIRHAEAVVLLPSWECSRGAQAEVHAAWCLDIPVYELEDFLAGKREEVPFL